MTIFIIILILILIPIAFFKKKTIEREQELCEPFVDGEDEIILFNLKDDERDKRHERDKRDKRDKRRRDVRIKALETQLSVLEARIMRTHNAKQTVFQKERILVNAQNRVSTAIAKAILNGDSVSHINIIDPGSNYTSPPVILFSGGSGTGAKAVSKVRDGHIVGIELMAGGTNYSSPPKIIFNREVFCGTNPVETVKSIRVKAAEFSKIHNEHVKDTKKRVNAAKKQWAPMLKVINEDKAITNVARNIGFPPPPSLFTDEQIEKVQRELNLKPRRLSESEKAKCMDLSDETKTTVESVEFLTRQGIDLPALRPDAQKKAALLEKLKTQYKKQCV